MLLILSFTLRLCPGARSLMPAAWDVAFKDDLYRHGRSCLRFPFVTAFGLQSLRLGRYDDYKLLQRYVFSVRKQDLKLELLDLQIMIRNVLRLLLCVMERCYGVAGICRRRPALQQKAPLQAGLFVVEKRMTLRAAATPAGFARCEDCIAAWPKSAGLHASICRYTCSSCGWCRGLRTRVSHRRTASGVRAWP